MSSVMCMVGIALSAATPKPDALALVERVQRVYTGAGDVTARFSQTYYDKLRGKRPTENGLMWAKRDGRVRWSYRAPARKDFVYTGRAAYFYEPSNAQVTVFEQFQDSPLANAIRFLWGQGKIVDSFDVSPCDASCQGAPDGTRSVLLRPKEALAAVEAIQLTAETATGKVQRSIVFDPLGNRTEYAFSSIEFGAVVADKKFAFRIPDGVNIIRATPDGR